MGKFDKPGRKFEKKPLPRKSPEKTPRALLLEKLRAKQKREEREKELILDLSEQLRKPRAPKKRPAISQKPERQQYYELPMGIKAKILSQKEKDRRGIKETPDSIGPKLHKKGRYPSQRQMAEIRRNHEFWDPNNSGAPLIEINENDLDKPILVCGTKEAPVKYTLKEFLRIDPKDIGDAPKGTYFQKGNEYYRKITRLSPTIIQKFGRLHRELENIVNQTDTFPLKNLTNNPLREIPTFLLNASNRMINGTGHKSVRIFIDENYRSYGENIYTYFKKTPEERSSKPSYFGRHASGDALDLRTFILVGVIRIGGRDAENLLRKAITAEWDKHGGGRGFYPTGRNFHMDARPKKGQWGNW